MTYIPHNHRRAYARTRVDGAANVFISDALQKPSILRNLSQRGACVMTDYPLAPTTQVTLEMVTPFFEKPIIRRAKVVWSRKADAFFWQAGLDFGLTNLIDFS